MKKLLNLVGSAALCFFALTATPELNAQIQSEFYDIKTVEKNYEPLGNRGEDLPYQLFYLPPASQSNGGMYDVDNGYTKVDLGFDFEYNGEIYNSVYVCINGFVTFSQPLNLPQNLQEGLFIDLPSSFQTNVLAPFWGDHQYRLPNEEFNPSTPLNPNQGYKASSIRYEKGSAANGYVFTVEWKNLQINKAPISYKSSVGTFQLKIYKSNDVYSKQGNIEFAYDQVGHVDQSPTGHTQIITKGATIGMKGEFNDYINGVHHNDPLKSRTLQTRTDVWQPSGATNRRIMFEAKQSFKIDEFWGDGDVDFSKAEGNRHYLLPQNRYVTINDARLILRAAATKIKLDSVRRKQAYHGDVNHNGRYFYTATGERYDIPQRDVHYADNLPNGINTVKKVYYQTTELDASMILNYLAARIPVLPWRYDTVLVNGKIIAGDSKANNIKIGESIDNGNGTITLPIHLNGNSVGAVAGKFEMNSEVVAVEKNAAIEDNNLLIDNENRTVVFAGSGEFNSEEALFFVTINKTSNVVLSDVVFNDNKVGNLATVNTNENSNVGLTNYPNPFTVSTNINLNITNAGTYSLVIYDMMGNRVKELANNFFSIGGQSLTWDATDANGNAVAPGMYIYKLTGNNEVLTNTMIINK